MKWNRRWTFWLFVGIQAPWSLPSQFWNVLNIRGNSFFEARSTEPPETVIRGNRTAEQSTTNAALPSSLQHSAELRSSSELLNHNQTWRCYHTACPNLLEFASVSFKCPKHAGKICHFVQHGELYPEWKSWSRCCERGTIVQLGLLIRPIKRVFMYL